VAWRSSVLAAIAVAAALPAAAANPGTYQVGTLPVAGAVGSVELPVGRSFASEVDLGFLGQGTYDDQNPFAYLSVVTPAAWLHWDGVQNLRLSAGFQELIYRAVPPLGLKDGHEERGLLRARIQQPHGEAALYQLAQLDVRSLDDAAGAHHVVWRPRFRVGQGFNLDAARIQSLVLYQEIGLRFASGGYTVRAFDFFRAFAGYTWTTRRGTFVTLGLLGQVSQNPAATRYDVFWGPVLAVTHRFRAAAPETPQPPPDVDIQ
jgi:hypothetical protein